MLWPVYFTIVGLLTLGLIFSGLNVSITTAGAEKCEDIKGTMKWGSTQHGDNDPSEKKFEKMIDGKASICEVAKCYDHSECEGVIKKDDWKDFKESIVYQGTDEDVQKCLEHRYKLPDDGDKALQAYEILDCATENY